MIATNAHHNTLINCRLNVQYKGRWKSLTYQKFIYE
jgi:hypothetical protein